MNRLSIPHFLCALEAESDTLASLGESVNVRVSGMGGEAVKKSLDDVQPNEINCIISWGVCGALEKQLQSGDIILPRHVIDQYGASFSCDSLWRERLRQVLVNANLSLAGQSDSLLSSDAIVTEVIDKIRLWKKTHADAVDMESFALARFAQQHNIPFVVVRAVADCADHSLPKAAMFEVGQSKVSLKTLISVLTHPLQWMALIKTAKQFNKALLTLKCAARSLHSQSVFSAARQD